MDDISEAKEKVEMEKARIDAAVQNLTDGLASFDENGKALSVNPKMTALTGLPTEAFYLEEFAKLLKGVDVYAKIKLAFLKRQSVHIEEVTLIGRFVYELFFTPVIDPQDRIIGSLILLHDITHLKEIDRMKTEFVSVASHQLRTPLTAIKLFVEMLLDGGVGDLKIEQRQYVENVQHSTERMIRLVNDLLNVSRLETGRLKIEPKPVQFINFIKDIIDEAIMSVAMREEKTSFEEYKGRVIFEKPEVELPDIFIDPSLMRQVIHNLLTNALKYSLKKSKVTIKLEKKDSGYLISVKDKGIGIPKDVQPRVFEKFFRSDNAMKTEAEGSGLGLYVAKMIIEAFGGKIWFESEEGKGTVFYVSLPAKGMKAKEGELGIAA